MTAGLEDDTVVVEEESSPPTAYYYSPNVPLDDDRWRGTTNDNLLASAEGDAANAAAIAIAASSSTNEYSFFDEAVITVRAGSGGQGSATFKKGTSGGQNGIADGGSGGRGGSVLFVTDPSLNTLAGLTNAWRPNSFGGSGAAGVSSNSATTASACYPKHFRAETGGDGERMYNNGRYGSDVIIRVPPGTVVQEQILDAETGAVVRTIDLGTLSAVNGDDDDDETSPVTVAHKKKTNPVGTVVDY